MNKTTLITAVVMLVLGAGAGYYFSPKQMGSTITVSSGEQKPLYYRNPMDPTITSEVPAKDSMGMDYVPVYAREETASDSKIVLYYRNPMNPSVTSPVPAKDSMGMDYVPVYAGGADKNNSTGMVSIDPVVVQNIGVRTAKAVQKDFGRSIRAVGRVDFDEQRMARLHPKVDGWIEKIFIDKTGEQVAEDTILLSIYSPKLVSTEQEYLLALKNQKVLAQSPIAGIRDGAIDLAKSARERLQLMDVPEHQIVELENSGKVKKNLHIHSPVAGTVIRIGSREGQYVSPKTELYMIVDLTKVWVYADVYDYELPWIKQHNKVEMTLASVPGRVFRGTVAYIYPYAESSTRTTKVRMVFDNPELLLRPDMFADITIESTPMRDVVVIPSEAIIRSGEGTQVFVQRGAGKFEPITVELGVESQGEVVVVSGVSAGDEVVTSSQFLVDSESKLNEATAKMMESLSQETKSKTAEKQADPGVNNTDGMDGMDDMDGMHDMHDMHYMHDMHDMDDKKPARQMDNMEHDHD